MIVTVSIVVATHDLSKGVMAGVVLSALIFAWKIAKIRITATQQADGSKLYAVHGQLFFGTTTHFGGQFTYQDDPDHVIIDLSYSHVWDHSAVNAISKVLHKYNQLDKQVKLIGLNPESQLLIEKVGISALSRH
ncbi:putative transporter [compost metagenome]